MNEISQFLGNTNAVISIPSLIVSLIIGLVLAMLLRWHYLRFGTAIANRREFAKVFPFVLLTTILIISVVKSSLALSLGLVGALSIVRFRTPIKEPEELAYLFITIAIGLGLGADQIVPTIIATLVILGSVAILRWKSSDEDYSNLFLSIEYPLDSAESGASHLNAVNELIMNHAKSSDIRRFDIRDKGLEATYIIEVEDAAKLGQIADELRTEFKDISVTFLDQNQLLSV